MALGEETDWCPHNGEPMKNAQILVENEVAIELK